MERKQLRPKVSRELTKKTIQYINMKVDPKGVVALGECVMCRCIIQFDHFKESQDRPQLCQVCRRIYE